MKTPRKPAEPSRAKAPRAPRVAKVKTATSKDKKLPHPLASGQVWRMEAAELRITELGRVLAQYTLARNGAPKPVSRISAIRAVEAYLLQHRAALVSSSEAPPTGRQARRR